MRRTRKPMSPVVGALRDGRIAFKRRIDVPMTDPKHLDGAIKLMSEAVDALRRIKSSNSLRDVDKVIYAQEVLQCLNWDCQKLMPKDPRPRGAAQYEYLGDRLHKVNTIGHAEVQAKYDQDNPNARPEHWIRKR